MHSPDSYDWGRGGDKVRDNRARFEGTAGINEFANELVPHLDLACVTNHMRCSFAAQLSSTSTTVVVLPGMEVNLQIEPIAFPRIHVLSILPSGSTQASFACLFSSIPDVPRDDAHRTGREVVTGLTLKEWVDKVHLEGGLCIAAHVDTNNGARLVFRQVAREVLRLFHEKDSTEDEYEKEIPDVLKNYLFDSGLDAIEIHKSDDVQHYRWVSRKDGQSRSIATLLTFDAHTCEAFGRKDRVTHVKMNWRHWVECPIGNAICSTG